MPYQMTADAKRALFNFTYLVESAIQNSNPRSGCFIERENNLFRYASQVPYPLMNGTLGAFNSEEQLKGELLYLKKRFSEFSVPITWFWPFDEIIPESYQAILKAEGFHDMGRFSSMMNTKKDILSHSIKGSNIKIRRVLKASQFECFIELTANIFGVPEIGIKPLSAFYSAYQNTDDIALYLGFMDEKPVAMIAAFRQGDTIGLYNGGTVEAYRKQGALSALVLHAIKDAQDANYVVAQLMAEQNAKGVCDSFGVKEVGSFHPFCYGFNLEALEV